MEGGRRLHWETSSPCASVPSVVNGFFVWSFVIGHLQKEFSMLVLSRKEGQQLLIGGYLVQINKIRGGQVVLGVEAPLDVPVLRAEVAEREARGAGRVTREERRGERIVCDGEVIAPPRPSPLQLAAASFQRERAG